MVTSYDGFLLFGSILLGLLAGTLGNFFVTSYFRWKDNPTKENKSTFAIFSIVIVIIFIVLFLAFVQYKP